MPVDPQTRTMLDALAGTPPTHEMPLDQARAAYAAMGPLAARPEGVTSGDRTVPGPGGDLPVRVYTPPGDAGARPGLVYLHGGGWTIGSIESHDGTAATYAGVAGCVVVSVDYRLAPEHRFPAALDDAEAAVRWVVDHAGDLGVDPSRLAVGGDSAGGNLATVLARRARDAGGPDLAAQLLVHPVTDCTCDRPSMTANATGYVLETDTMRWFIDQYAPGDERRSPDASPLLADDLSGLPPAVVATAEFDPLRDQGEAYAQRLRDAGVPVVHRRYDGLIHTFTQIPLVSDRSRAALEELARDLRGLLTG